MSIKIAGSSVPTLEQLASFVGIDCAAYVGQSLLLGISLADVLFEANGGAKPSILFEQSDGEYDAHVIDFSPKAPGINSADMHEFEGQFTSPVFKVDVDPASLAALDQCVSALQTTPEAFLERSMEYRYFWAIARSSGRAILLQDHDLEGMLELEGDPF